MHVYKVSMQIRKTGSARHNGREGERGSRDGHIDTARSGSNVYISYKGLPFTEAEKTFCRDQYSGWIKKQNERCIKQRHKERMISPESILRSPKTRPDEIILQIGDRNAAPDAETFRQCAFDFIHELEQYSDHCHILDAAIHNDEETPHCHIRLLWDYTDEYGDRRISADRALKEMGIAPPDPALPDNLRYNNRKITFDNRLRDRWKEICRSHGIEIEQNKVSRQEHRDPAQYKQDRLRHDAESLRMEIEQMRLRLDEQKREKERLDAELVKSQRAYMVFNGPDAAADAFDRLGIPDLVSAHEQAAYHSEDGH